MFYSKHRECAGIGNMKNWDQVRLWQKVVKIATVLLRPLEEQESPYINGIGFGADDNYTASLYGTTDAGQDTGTASHKQLTSDDIVEISIAGGESVPLNSQFATAERSKHKCKIKKGLQY